jgi:MFS superfamily sulfate permease-like transporter
LAHAAVGRVKAVLPNSETLGTMRRSPRRDLVSGLTVAVVALPLALGFGITSGAGAQAGLVTAVVAGALAAVFGGSNLQVTGPTGAMTVVLVPIVHSYGVDGVMTVGLMAGIILVVILRMSRISVIDSSGARVLEDAIDQLAKHGVLVLVSGIRPEHHRPLDALGTLNRLREAGHVFATTPQAIAFAHTHLAGAGIVPTPHIGDRAGAAR